MAKKSKEEALGEDQLICVLSGNVVKATPKELNLQSIIEMLNEEYGLLPAPSFVCDHHFRPLGGWSFRKAANLLSQNCEFPVP